MDTLKCLLWNFREYSDQLTAIIQTRNNDEMLIFGLNFYLSQSTFIKLSFESALTSRYVYHNYQSATVGSSQTKETLSDH